MLQQCCGDALGPETGSSRPRLPDGAKHRGVRDLTAAVLGFLLVLGWSQCGFIVTLKWWCIGCIVKKLWDDSIL